MSDQAKKKKAEELPKEQEEQINLAAKMSALGQFAGGIAHEINNPLSIIHSKAGQLKELAQEKKIDHARLVEISEKIESTVMRIVEIVKGLKFFAHNSSQDPYEATSVRTIIDNTLEFIQEKLGRHGVTLTLSDFSDDLTVECRHVQIAQVLLNILSNGVSAVEALHEKWLAVNVVSVGDTVQFEVIDAGSGIPPDIQEKMFQPLFSTKRVGIGTGLGLNISREIVKAHGGTIHIDNTRANTCFVITLPKKQAVRQAA